MDNNNCLKANDRKDLDMNGKFFYYVQFMLYGLRNTLVFQDKFAMNDFVNHSQEYYSDNFKVIAFFDRIV